MSEPANPVLACGVPVAKGVYIWRKRDAEPVRGSRTPAPCAACGSLVFRGYKVQAPNGAMFVCIGHIVDELPEQSAPPPAGLLG